MTLLLSITDGDDVPYLFRSSSGVVEFVILEERLGGFHEFCVVCQRATVSASRNASESLQRQEATNPRDPWLETALEGEALQWKHSEEVLLSGTIVVMLLAVVENCLGWLNVRWSEDQNARVRPKSGQSKIDAYLECFGSVHGLGIGVPPNTKAALDTARRIRNHVAHGDWEEIEKELKNMDETRAFGAVSSLFGELERAYLVKSTMGEGS